MSDFNYQQFALISEGFLRSSTKRKSVRVLVDIMWQKHVIPYCSRLDNKQRASLANDATNLFFASYDAKKNSNPTIYFFMVLQSIASKAAEHRSPVELEELDEFLLSDSKTSIAHMMGFTQRETTSHAASN